MAEDNIFEEIINRVRNRFFNLPEPERNFNNANFENLWITETRFDTWTELMRPSFEALITENWQNIQMIICASSGAPNFNEKLAMIVGENEIPTSLPPTVINLIQSLHYSLRENPALFVTPALRDLHYDYHCRQLRDNVLFINVCLSGNNRDHCNAVCSIAFINELLRIVQERNGRKLAVLDFRLLMHKHVNNVNQTLLRLNDDDDEELLPRFAGERDIFNDTYRQDHVFYEIVNPENYHNYYPLCHPLYLDVSVTRNDNGEIIRLNQELNFTREMFVEIANNGYPIRQMYMPPGNIWN